MARRKNQEQTVKLTVSTTSQVKAFLDLLVLSGAYGKTPSEAADRVLAEALVKRVREAPGGDPVAEALQARMKESLRAT